MITYDSEEHVDVELVLVTSDNCQTPTPAYIGQHLPRPNTGTCRI